MVVFTFSVLDWKHPFWANLVQKIKIVSLSWNLVPRIIRIRRIQWGCSFFFVLEGKHSFWANLVQQIKVVRLSLNSVPRLTLICRTQWWCSLFLFYTKTPFFTVSVTVREQGLSNKQLSSTRRFLFCCCLLFLNNLYNMNQSFPNETQIDKLRLNC